MSISQDFYRHAKTLIPGGTQLLSKRPEQFCPEQWPNYAVKAKGCEVWDLDGKHYYDMTSTGIGSCLLGFADPDVSKAVITRIENGSMSTLNAPEEVHLAEKLIEIHPWAEQARFARCGGEACAISVRIARATTGRDIVAICGYHGWTDWYLAANLADDTALDGQLLPGLKPAGVPRGLTGTTVTFKYESFEEFDAIIREYGDRLACVIMEPMHSYIPKTNFLQHVRDEAHRVGALLIFDEVTIGWRMTYGGSHKELGINPDMAVFAKALGNGHPTAAVIGTKAAMDGAHESFISSTYWTEAVGPTAALATLKKMEVTNASAYAMEVGRIVQKDWQETADRYGLPAHAHGIPCLSHLDFDDLKLPMKTLYISLMLKEGFMANTLIYPTLAHTEEILQLHREAVDRVFCKMAEIYKQGEEAVLAAIGGPVCTSGFKRLAE